MKNLAIGGHITLNFPRISWFTRKFREFFFNNADTGVDARANLGQGELVERFGAAGGGGFFEDNVRLSLDVGARPGDAFDFSAVTERVEQILLRKLVTKRNLICNEKKHRF